MADFNQIKACSGIVDAASCEGALRACEAALGVGLTLHDVCGFFRDTAGDALLLERKIHPHALCLLQRQATFRACGAHCVDAVHAHAATATAPFLTACWKGIREIVVPLRHEERPVGVLFAGPWRSPLPPPDFTGIAHQRRLEELQRQLPVLEQPQILAQQLQLWGEGLVQQVVALRQRPTDDRAAIIGQFLFRHAGEQVGLGDLARRLGISSSRCSHLVREVMGMGFQELLLKERIERASVLLRSSPLRLADIAERCGFSDVYYFSRCFRRRTGLAPGRFRSQTQGKSWNS